MTESKRSHPPRSDAPAAGGPALARRPMARATRIALFEREVRERLSPAALELVLGRAEVISEGQRGLRNGRDAYFGSTMLTIDLPSLDLLLRDACDAGTARRLEQHERGHRIHDGRQFLRRGIGDSLDAAAFRR